MKMRTSELTGTALDWAVAKCEGYTPVRHSSLATIMVERMNARGCMQLEHIHSLRFSTDWAQGGPIIERERIVIGYINDLPCASLFEGSRHSAMEFGPTPLIAAMRCYCCAKLGPEIEIPDSLGEQP